MDNLEKAMPIEENQENAPVEQPEVTTEFEKTQDKVDEIDSVENKDNIEDTSGPASDYVKKEEEDEKEDSSSTDEAEDESEDSSDEAEKDDEDEKKKYTLLEEELKTLQDKYTALEAQYQELVNFKTQIDNQNKDALIAEFYMLSEEDKADVIQNKEKYTLDEIKAKLSVICFDKKINFALENNETTSNNNKTPVVYNLENNGDSSLPDWVKAVKEQEQSC